MATIQEIVVNQTRVKAVRGEYQGTFGNVNAIDGNYVYFRDESSAAYGNISLLVEQLEVTNGGIVRYEGAEVSTLLSNLPARRLKAMNAGKIFHFVKGKSEFHGEVGWRPKEIPNFDPVAPSMVLHDILEHEPNSPATPEEEYKALGAAHWLRFEGGYFAGSGDARASETLKSAYGMLFFHTIRAERNTKPADLENEEAFTPLARMNTEWEMFRGVSAAMDYLPSRFNPVQMRYIQQSLFHAMPWMRIGYRSAAKRFAGLNQVRLARMYRLAQEEIDFHLKRANDTDVLQIICNPHQYQAAVSMIRPLVA